MDIKAQLLKIIEKLDKESAEIKVLNKRLDEVDKRLAQVDNKSNS